MVYLLLACVDTAPAARTHTRPDPADTGTPDDTGVALPHAADVVAELRADGAAAFTDWAESSGWPVATSEGMLFVYEAGGAWSVAGDFDAWAGEPMACGGGLCSVVVPDVANDGGYKFTNGSAWVADPWARRCTYDENGELSLLGTEEAHLERWFAVGDDRMEPRTVRVWLPKGTVTHVLYAEDGQNLFDPQAMWGGWHLQDSVPAGMLVVGIDNTPARFDEYTHVPDHLDDSGDWYGGEGDAYASFVAQTVRPLVRLHYGEPAAVGLLGSSLGGLISLHIALQQPGEYTFAASLSGTLGWGSIGAHNETMIARYSAAGHGSTALYLDSGGQGPTCADTDADGTDDDDANSADNYCETVQLRDALLANGYAYDVDLWHWWEPGATHDEVSWAARVFRPLDLFASL